MLEGVLGHNPHGTIRLSEEIDAEGAPFLKLASKMDLEVIIAKRRDTPYRSSRGGEWLKIKCIQSESFEPSAIALGVSAGCSSRARRGDGLVYVGGVGIGFTQASATALRKQMGALIIDKPAIIITGRKHSYRWLKPALFAEIAFRAWTDDSMLWRSSFKGLREDANAASAFELP